MIVYKFLCTISLVFVLFGLVISNVDIFEELKIIIISPDYLITDYFEIAGIGGAFLNSGLLMFAFICILKLLKINPSGVSIAAIMTIGGFALFGKNIFNVWPIVIGVFLYTIMTNENIRTYLYVALFGTALAPVTTHLVLKNCLNLNWIGLLFAILIGFLLPPLASFALTLHRGYNLYNVGFTAGFLGMFLGSILKAYELHPEPRYYWHTENQLLLSIFVYSLFYLILLYGLKLNNWSFSGYKNVFKYSGKLLTDFVLLENEAITFINVGILGLLGTSYVLLIGAPINGPTIGGIMTLAGFGALGKHPKNIFPVISGTIIGALTNSQAINSAGMVLAVLFGTTLAPIAGEFGIIWGIIAGFLHSSLVMNLSFLHLGMNLYNNGFSGGFVAMFLLAIIDAWKKLKEAIGEKLRRFVKMGSD
ncbi:DUF1576 domain-containing protein [Fervidobacterium nodosum]|uniref:DUF1576 domain-containing protein n=1 Tax=Fervidobacterium nodosum (strain ATCC 35602 / DSM 5306 / Rt17-B1) TaxID=381764 RepID=A7HKB0_FERNB|nr:DUF1576 domain-containing protein [Fervidobacterium nodosum]ABS60343.1 protein of unknown function DUF1576 [Fervidobacterium nodosum Rt17-B1]